MPFKFRKSFKILPGVKINLSKGGISTSLGGAGHSVNIGKKGVKSTIGIPGTGISHTSNLGGSAPKISRKKRPGCGLGVILFLTAMAGYLVTRLI